MICAAVAVTFADTTVNDRQTHIRKKTLRIAHCSPFAFLGQFAPRSSTNIVDCKTRAHQTLTFLFVYRHHLSYRHHHRLHWILRSRRRRRRRSNTFENGVSLFHNVHEETFKKSFKNIRQPSTTLKTNRPLHGCARLSSCFLFLFCFFFVCVRFENITKAPQSRHAN